MKFPTLFPVLDIFPKLFYNIQVEYADWKTKHGDLGVAIADDKRVTIDLNATGVNNIFRFIDNNSAVAQTQQKVLQLGLQ